MPRRLALLLAAGLAVGYAVACASPEAGRDAAFARADAALALGDVDRAEAVLAAQLAYDPRDVATAERLATLLLDHGRGPRALRVLEAVPGDVEVDVEHRLLLGRAQLAYGRVAMAAAIFAALDGRVEVPPADLERVFEVVACTWGELPRAVPASWWPRIFEHRLCQGCLEHAADTLRHLDPSDPEHPRRMERLRRLAERKGELELLRRLTPCGGAGCGDEGE